MGAKHDEIVGTLGAETLVVGEGPGQQRGRAHEQQVPPDAEQRQRHEVVRHAFAHGGDDADTGEVRRESGEHQSAYAETCDQPRRRQRRQVHAEQVCGDHARGDRP